MLFKLLKPWSQGSDFLQGFVQGTLIGSNANNAFSSVASSLH